MKKIMIVDDDVTSVAIVKALLEPEFEVVSANTGVEALGELQRSPDLNLILLDMVMPGVSGMDLLKVLKKSENWSNISVIFLTSLEGVDIELEGFTNGASDFLQKPVNAELLRLKIKRQLFIQDLKAENQHLQKTMSSCSMMAQSIGSVVSGTTYPSDDPELVAVEADYAAKEAALQAEIDNIESSHPGYDEYRYDLDMIGHDPHELAAYLSAVLQGYTRQSAQAELERVFDAQYQLTLTEEVEVRYRTETRTDSEGNSYTVQVPYNYYILNVKLTSKPISSVASELLTPEQLEMYQVYRQTLGNKPLIFGGGSPDMSNSEDLTGVVFVNGTRPGNQAVVDIAKSQVGNVGGQPYWSWYGFNSRVEWCACFVSWCYGQMGLSEPRFAACQSQGIPWFQSHGQWGGRDYANIAPGDAIFFDWDLDGSADHVGLVVGTDGSRVYTVEGNSGDACKIKSYSLSYECIKGYGLMNW